MSNAVRAVKAQEAKFRGQGLTPGQAGKAAAAAALNQKGFTPKKSQKQKERDKKCAPGLTSLAHLVLLLSGVSPVALVACLTRAPGCSAQDLHWCCTLKHPLC